MLVPYCWAMAITFAFFGVGRALMRRLYGTVSWVISGGVGVCLFVAVGGWMNLFGLVRPTVILSLVILGDALFLGELYYAKRVDPRDFGLLLRKHNSVQTVISAAIILLLACLILANVKPKIFNRYDDPQAYMAYPQKMLQTGSLPSDPFSERRILTSLGGGYFLQAMMLPGGDERSIAFIDAGVGFLLYAFCIWSFARQQGLSEVQAIGILYLIPLLPLFYINLTFVALSAALFLVMVLWVSFIGNKEQSNYSQWLVLGLIAGALCTLKSTNIVFALPFLVLFGLTYAALKRNLKTLLSILFACITTLFTVFPWALQQKITEGTYLFPVLGKGFHASAYGQLPTPLHTASIRHAFVPAVPHMLMLIMALAFVWRLTEKDSAKVRAALLAFFAAAIIATPVIALSVSGVAVDRFTFPFQVPALVIFAVMLFRGVGRVGKPHCTELWVSACCLLSVWIIWIMVSVGFRQRLYIQEPNLLATWLGASPPHLLGSYYILTAEQLKYEEQRAVKVQSMIPAGASVYEVVFSAYPYDFKRNVIYIADYPGMAGLPPGIPVGKGPDAVRKYFLSHSIRYILCDRKLTWENQDVQEFLNRPEGNGSSGGWTTMEDHVSRDVRHNIRLLARTDHRIYDDGEVMAIKLK